MLRMRVDSDIEDAELGIEHVLVGLLGLDGIADFADRSADYDTRLQTLIIHNRCCSCLGVFGTDVRRRGARSTKLQLF